MYRTPGPYNAWVSWLAAFGRGEDLPAAHLLPVGPDMGPQMLARLARHIAEAFHDRQQRWSDAFVRDRQMLIAEPRHAVSALAVVLADARIRLMPLVAFTVHSGLPADLKQSLADALKETVSSAQRSLEDSARELPLDLRNAIRQNGLLPALNRTAPVRPVGHSPSRRVILG